MFHSTTDHSFNPALRVSMLAVLALAGSAFAARAIPLDDFEDLTDRRWAHVDATADECVLPAIYDASSGAYRIESACPIAPDSDAFAAATFAGDGGLGASSRDGYVRAAVVHLSWTSNVWLSLRSWGDERIGLWGYRFEVAPDGSRIAIVREWEHDSSEVLAEALFIRPLFNTGDLVMIEAGAIGRHLSLKVWAAGTEEPAAPQLVSCDLVHMEGDLAIGVSHAGSGDGLLAVLFDGVELRPASADVNDDGVVDHLDAFEVLAAMGKCRDFDCPADINGDGYVDDADLEIVLRNLPGWPAC